MNKPVSLEDVIPTEPEFRLEKLDRSFRVRPPNMLDQVWFKEKYPEGRIQEIMRDLDWAEIVKIIYHQLSNEDRSLFPATKAKIVNEEGEEAEKRLSGPEHLLENLSGLKEAMGILTALTRAIMISNPLAAEAIEEELKKNLVNLNRSTSQKSSISSKPNTAGKKSTSRR